MSRRSLLGAAARLWGAGALGLGVAARAETAGPCPELAGRRVRWIVPMSPGGGYDVYARLMERVYEGRLGAELVVENLPGGGGILGANVIRRAAPNGLTQGIVNGPGLLVAALAGAPAAPNPVSDFTILGRVARSEVVWMVGAGSPIRTVDDLFTAGKGRPVVFGATDVGSVNFVGLVVGAMLLGMEPRFVVGFPGSREVTLAAIRGDVDVVGSTFDSVRDRIQAGDLRPVLQVSDHRIAEHPALEGVPLLGGEAGLAVRRATQLGRPVAEAQADAEALAGLIGGGLLVVAPPSLPEGLVRCLDQTLHEALADPAFREAVTRARRSLDVARGETARAELARVVERARRFVPLVQEAIKKLRS